MNKKQIHIHFFVLVLVTAVLFCLQVLYRHPSNKLIQTTRLIEANLSQVNQFYTTRFISEVRTAMCNAVLLDGRTDSTFLLAIQQAPPDKIFIVGLTHIMQHKAGWPTVKDSLNHSTTVQFTIRASRNFVMSVTCLHNKHLIFDTASGLDGLFELEMESWKRMILASPDNPE